MHTLLLATGYFGQALFAGRVIYQWFASERAGRVVVPRGYWWMSLAGSALVLAYGVGKHNLVFVMSVLPGTVIAYLNLRIRRKARRRKLLPWAVALLAVVVWAAWKQPRVGEPAWAVIGLVGSLMWGLRHVFQWWVSQRRGEPMLPVSFYLLSLFGSFFLLAYAIRHVDYVMILGYAFNSVPYIRILLLLRAPRAAGSS
ncbi:MAG TPA: lipid-A-disaccharide synthase N-terminal domain-containing protein [Planctomycetota bacterium]|nr:lipid-A-disaccharide synthase N-terminal domain-containing protein [Planctomycetota bacterium]